MTHGVGGNPAVDVTVVARHTAELTAYVVGIDTSRPRYNIGGYGTAILAW